MQSQQGIAPGTRNGPIQSSLDQSLTEGIMDKNEEGQYILEENHSQYSREKELAHQLNRFRFKNQKIIQKLLTLIGGEEGGAVSYQTSIYLPELNREIKFQNEEIVKKLRNYIHEIDIVNQILSDFTFNPTQNQEFVNMYKQQVLQNKILFDQNSERIRQKLQAQAYYSYYLKDVSLKNYDELIILLLIEEFIILNSQSRQSDSLTLDFSHSPQHLGLIDNLYNKLFVIISDKKEQSSGGISEVNNEYKEKSNAAAFASDPNSLYDVFILLIYDDNINTNQDLNTPLMKNTNFKNGMLSQTAMQMNSQNQPLTNTQRTDRFNQSLYPQKYKQLIKRSTQIPKTSILTLVDLMDSNADRRVTLEDIKQFSHKKFIYYKDNIYQEMFEDVVKLRRTTFQEQKSQPLTVDEIWAAVQMHYKLGPNHEWIENPRPYRKYWVQLLQAAGERLPKQHDLPSLTIQPIKDQHQITILKNKSQLSKTKSCIDIKNIPKKQYLKPFRAEAGIVVNNTENIQEVVQDYREQMSHLKEPEPFEKVVNLKFKHPENGELQTVTFETKNYFNEAERLSKNPHQYKTQAKNPIYSFVPENFNFQINNQNQAGQNAITQSQVQTQGQEFFQNDKKGKQSIRFSKALSSNMGGFIPNYDQDSISQLKEIDDMEEYDAESLMKTQSIRLSTLRAPSRNPHQTSNQYHKTSLPHLGASSNQKKGSYPYNVFDSQFYSRKYQINKVVTPLEKNLDEKQIFITTFKVENCQSLKQKLSQKEPIKDVYNPVSQVQFRESHTPEKKEPYITRFKCDSLPNPYGMSQHDSRPKEALEREQKEKKRKQEEEQKKIDEFMGKTQQDKPWVKYFKLADMDHNFVDQNRPQLLEKGSYADPSSILYNLLRGDSEYKLPFKLAHRTLRAGDKNLFLGEVPDSKF
ncbi:hypothetical protein TTHERM_00732510 (macronuclear) [Tetrahymena thermophila SB210]|uniref:Uncharacterized protein n=1 Tax=Tetrahymena thermophila (strain SB210) TaxID=312017 RepID=Q245G0_TETTS|nr:hypothetical protein TTHERM_00732510 [Tetrahymena thermophila SB210]EAS03404.2 hypothetical protein TTHERM_00732510 [Tetrahymena thermophila SB210]|eukprot:XP_001023649.2 hypothetical protein TTHERM_00732510 [Tetrahymena thermophila SB210]